MALRLVSRPASTAPASVAAEPLAAVSAAAAGGDPAAVETLLLSVGPAMLRGARGVLGANHPDIEDVLQEAALGLLDALASFEGKCSVVHFASRIAVLKALDARRRRARSDKRSEELPLSLPADDRSPIELAVDARRRELIDELIETLPHAQSEALILHCALGFTIEEVAEVSQVPCNTVRSRLRLAKEAVRSRIAKSPTLRQALEDMP